MTGCGMMEREEDRFKPWIFPDTLGMDDCTKKKLLTEALRIVLLTLLRTHIYEFAGSLKLQKEGGPIGMEITGVVAQVFMVWWDRQLKQRLNQINLQVKMHQRYVDDTNIIAKQTPVGAGYDGEQMTINEATIAEDETIPPDKRTMRLIQTVASYIHPSIRLTIDYPTKHRNGKVPMLDVNMWIMDVGDEKKVVYEHYEKPMTTKSVMHAKSAVSMQVKRTVLSQEVLRILLHCSRYVTWENVSTHINNFLKKMQYSGYNQNFRYNVVNSALNAMKIIREKEELGLRPINRPKGWKREEREKEKEEKKRKWYKNGGFDSVIFVPSTPKSVLKQMYQQEISKSGIRIKVVEKTGTTLKAELQTSNPFKPQRCGRELCFVCSSEGTGNCDAMGITYEIKCKGNCEIRNIYKGETADSAYTRGLQHRTHLTARNITNSPLWRHCREAHDGILQEFQMNVTGTFRNDAMLRQITEAVQIKNIEARELMNTRAEWNMTRVPRTIITHE